VQYYVYESSVFIVLCLVSLMKMVNVIMVITIMVNLDFSPSKSLL